MNKTLNIIIFTFLAIVNVIVIILVATGVAKNSMALPFAIIGLIFSVITICVEANE